MVGAGELDLDLLVPLVETVLRRSQHARAAIESRRPRSSVAIDPPPDPVLAIDCPETGRGEEIALLVETVGAAARRPGSRPACRSAPSVVTTIPEHPPTSERHQRDRLDRPARRPSVASPCPPPGGLGGHPRDPLEVLHQLAPHRSHPLLELLPGRRRQVPRPQRVDVDAKAGSVGTLPAEACGRDSRPLASSRATTLRMDADDRPKPEQLGRSVARRPAHRRRCTAPRCTRTASSLAVKSINHSAVDVSVRNQSSSGRL